MQEAGKTEKYEQYRHELELQRVKPAGKDERISAYCEASLDALDSIPDYRGIVEDVLLEREDLSPTYAVNIVLRSLQKQLMYRRGSGYPNIYDRPEPWVDSLEYVSESRSTTHQDFVEDISSRTLQSNVSERYKAVKLVAQMMESRVGKRPSILDVGCSRNHGLKKLTTGKKFPFRNIGAAELLRNSSGDLVTPPLQDKKTAYVVGSMLEKGLRLSKSVGLDIVPINDEDARIWARSCSFYPSELLSERRVKEYDALDALERKNVSFQQADFSDINIEEFRQNNSVKNFDIINFSTILYQVTEAQQKRMLANAKELLKPDGIILIQDFVDVNRRDPTKLEFFDNWFKEPFLYRTIMLDPKVSSDEFVPLFRWDNGRCNRLMSDTAAGRMATIDMKALERYSQLSAGAKRRS